jgi:DNA-binding transcriptional ArsR family regulator
MMKENEEGIPIGEAIVKQLGNPKRAKTLYALNKRIEICEKLIRDNADKLTAADYEVIEEYKKLVLIQENALTTEVKVMGLKEIRLPPKQHAQARAELLDKHQERHKAILTGTYKENMRESNLQINSEQITMKALLKDFNTETTPAAEQQITKHWSDGVHIPGIHPPKEELKQIVYFNNAPFLSSGNLCVIVAAPGSGKSSICESILSNILNPDCDALNFKVSDEVQRAVYFDGERALPRLDKSNERMLQRAGVIEHKEKCLIVGLRENFTIKAKRQKIIDIVEGFKPQLVLIDGIGDLITNTNSEDETNDVYLWIIELITKYDISIITTLHPNKNSDTARGWIGSELLRRCEGVLLVKINRDDTRTISTEKQSNGEKTKSSYKWDKGLSRMITCDNQKPGVTKSQSIFEIITAYDIEMMKQSIDKDAAGDKKAYKYGELLTTIQKYLKEEHPHLTTGDNAVGVFIKDLCFNNVHLNKVGKAPNTTYLMQINERELRLDAKLKKEGDDLHTTPSNNN